MIGNLFRGNVHKGMKKALLLLGGGYVVFERSAIMWGFRVVFIFL